MAQAYNPQWDRQMAVDNALMHRMRADNFAPVHTGGGCWAWQRVTEDGGWIWITDESGVSLGEWHDRSRRVWLVGRYSADGEDSVCMGDATLAQALALADTMAAPVPNSGHRVA